jgi:hypothetical protein
LPKKMKKDSKIKLIFKKIDSQKIFIFLGTVLILFIALTPPFDPDLGWHLANGQYLWTHNFQVARNDIFSYTMPNFPVIMHEWGMETALYPLYKNLGLFSLSIVFAFIISGAFLLAAFGMKSKKEHKIIAAILAIIASIPILGVRPQMASLLGLALVIFIILKFRRNPESKIIWFLPAVFLLWTNLHGGFAIGLFFIFLFLAIELAKRFFLFIFSYRQKIKKSASDVELSILEMKSFRKLSLIFSISCAATLVNPYGWRIYVEVFTTIFDSYAKSHISEWFPLSVSDPISYQFIIYAGLLLILLIFNWRKLDYTYLAITASFFYLALLSWRNMPLFLIVITPLWVALAELLSGIELGKLIRKKYFLAAMLILVFLVGQKRIQSIFVPSVEKFSQAGYPVKAIEYLKKNPIEGNMFNEYNWGGFLDWQYPGHKVFIDGRMPSWKIGNSRAFQDFVTISHGDQGWEDLLKKYDIRYALVYNLAPNKARFDYLKWKEAYSDNLSVIYENPN